ncbi:MAG: hypothetical protein LM517_11115 [Nitrosomonas sp.]|nr:hypothetical protein [Nitrosomonas sp.]
MSFGALELAERLKRENVLMKIDALIEWEELRPKLRVYTSASYRAWWKAGTV